MIPPVFGEPDVPSCYWAYFSSTILGLGPAIARQFARIPITACLHGAEHTLGRSGVNI